MTFEMAAERMRIQIRRAALALREQHGLIPDTAASGTAGNQPPHRTRNAASHRVRPYGPIPPVYIMGVQS